MQHNFIFHSKNKLLCINCYRQITGYHLLSAYYISTFLVLYSLICVLFWCRIKVGAVDAAALDPFKK